MGFVSILVLAVALAMDATAVAAARGLAAPRVTGAATFRVALLFGGSQALMPLLGGWLGALVGPLVAAWDHWIAFVLLALLGAKMIREAWGADEADDDAPLADPFAWRPLLVLAFATSIDAFAVGITLPMLGAPMPLALVTIGLVTAALSCAGLHLGRAFGALAGRKLELFGGGVLIALGVKILVQGLIEG